MATGSGKTTVMGMLAAWSILNKVNSRGDARFSDVVLVVCPNVTIRERLAELDPNRGDASIYRTADLVPADLMPSLRRGRVLVKNWHEFERKGMSAGSKVQKNGVPELRQGDDQDRPEDDLRSRRPIHDRAGARDRCCRGVCGSSRIAGQPSRRSSSRRRATSRATRS